MPAANVLIGAAKGIHVRVLPRVRLISPAPDNGIARHYKGLAPRLSETNCWRCAWSGPPPNRGGRRKPGNTINGLRGRVGFSQAEHFCGAADTRRGKGMPAGKASKPGGGEQLSTANWAVKHLRQSCHRPDGQ